MPNNFAYLALILWPLIAIKLYRKKEVIPATFWTIVGGYLLLPVGVEIDFPLIPSMNKETIPAIMAFLGCKYIAKEDVKILPPKGIERNLILLFFLGAIGTVLTNGDPIVVGNNYLPGLSFRDLFSVIMGKYLLLLPFILGIQLIKTTDDQVQLFKLIVVAGLLYSVLILFEIRMSPQLHKWIYGFFPHTWGQQVRYGGFRPVVFLGHGLWVSMFTVIVIGAAVTLSKLKMKLNRPPNAVVIAYLVLLLILSKGFGSMILGAILLLIIGFFKPRVIFLLSIVIGLLSVAYPFLCLIDIFPHQLVIENIESINPAQAGSLQFRFNHEIALLERATDRFLFGWGAWGRNRLGDSVVDGYWIGLIGMYGVVGFISIFGLMFIAIWKTRLSLNYLQGMQDKFSLASLSLMVSLIMVDQIPNHSENPFFWFLTGALIGRHLYILKSRSIERTENSADVINARLRNTDV